MTLEKSRAFDTAHLSAMFHDERTSADMLLQRTGGLPARTPEGVRAKAHGLQAASAVPHDTGRVASNRQTSFQTATSSSSTGRGRASQRR